MQNKMINVKGMHCKSCEMLVEDALEEMGVESKASHENGNVEVTFNENKVSLDDIKKIIENEGYEVK